MVDSELLPPPVPPRENTYSYNNDQQSYNSWRYGEEASLYSIAEDSRERSEANTTTNGEVPPAMLPPVLSQDEEPTQPWDTSIEVKWVDDAQQPEEALTETPEDDDDNETLEEPRRLGPGHSSRRTRFAAAAIFALLAITAIVLGTALRNQGDAQPRSTVSSGVDTSTAGTPVEPPTTTTTTETLTPEQWAERISRLSQAKVTDAVASCTDLLALQDTTSYQGLAFDLLWTQVADDVQIVDNAIVFAEKHDDEALQEMFALLTLYYATGGQGWSDALHWGSTEDLCTWFGTAGCDLGAPEGACVVSVLDLRECHHRAPVVVLDVWTAFSHTLLQNATTSMETCRQSCAARPVSLPLRLPSIVSMVMFLYVTPIYNSIWSATNSAVNGISLRPMLFCPSCLTIHPLSTASTRSLESPPSMLLHPSQRSDSQ